MPDTLRTQLQSSLGSGYTIERELGGGGMSRVFLADETRFHRRVVIKVLAPELSADVSTERFEREIKLAAGLQQANIVPVITAGEVDGLPWYTMPYVDGESLRARMARGACGIGESVAILKDIARALAYAHARGIVHRDIKPENVLVSGGVAAVTDFGIAKAVSASKTHASGSTLTQVGTSLGTPAYMAPEQGAGDTVDLRADLYAWGVMAYELLSGAHPFAGKMSAQQLIAAHIAEVPRPLAPAFGSIPAPLVALVARCMEKDAGRRPQSANEILDTLDAVLTPVPPALGSTAPRRRGWNVVVPLSAAAIVVFVVLAWKLGFMPGYRGGGAPTSSAAGQPVQSIAVLPFANVGGDTAQEYFADGMTEEISSVLAKIPNLRVAARRSAFAYKGKQVASAEIGRALGVGLLLEGRIRREGDRVRVTAELSDAAAGGRRWSGKWDTVLRDAFQVQDSIAQAIAGELRLALGGNALNASRAGRTSDPAAHDLALRARAHINPGSEQELRRAIALFQEALVIDPGFAQAQAGIATAWAFLADAFVPSREAYPHMRDAALAALRSDSLLAEAHGNYGYALIGTEWALAAGEREMRRALELDPNSFDAALFLSNYLCGAGRKTEGLELSARVIRLEPLAVTGSWNRELCLYFARQWDDVIAQHRVTMKLDSTLVVLDDLNAASLREKGQFSQAVAAYEHTQRLSGGSPLFGLAVTYSRMGRHDDARRIMQALEARSRHAYVPAEVMAAGYAGIGDKEHALGWMQRAVDARSMLILTVRTWPEYDSLRGDPRYEALVRRIGVR